MLDKHDAVLYSSTNLIEKEFIMKLIYDMGTGKSIFISDDLLLISESAVGPQRFEDLLNGEAATRAELDNAEPLEPLTR